VVGFDGIALGRCGFRKGIGEVVSADLRTGVKGDGESFLSRQIDGV